MQSNPTADQPTEEVQRLMADERVIRMYVAIRDVNLTVLESASGLHICWTVAPRRGITGAARDIHRAILALAGLDPQRAGRVPAGPHPRDTVTTYNTDWPPGRSELRRLSQYHLFLAHTNTLPVSDRDAHRRAARLLHQCDPRQWSDVWQREPADVVRGRIAMHLAALAALTARDDPDTAGHLRAAHTVLTTCVDVPSAAPAQLAGFLTQWFTPA